MVFPIVEGLLGKLHGHFFIHRLFLVNLILTHAVTTVRQKNKYVYIAPVKVCAQISFILLSLVVCSSSVSYIKTRPDLFLKGIFQPFELGGVTRLIPSAVKFCKAGH